MWLCPAAVDYFRTELLSFVVVVVVFVAVFVVCVEILTKKTKKLN